MTQGKEVTDANAWIVAGLKAQGFDASGAELERLASVLSEIESDLGKLDALGGVECNSTPSFRVKEEQ